MATPDPPAPAARPKPRVSNPPNRFLTRRVEWLDEPPPADLEIVEDRSRSILVANDSPDLPFRWSVNPYRGCTHACAYCYARPTHEYLGLGGGSDFDRVIHVKSDAPQLLDRAFRRRGWARETVVFSGVTDAWQPIEAARRLTRGCLEVCHIHRNPVSVVTKSSLIRRDVDLLAEMARAGGVTVALSIPFLDETITRAIEPGAPTVARRFETMRALADAGVRTGIAVAPLVPGLGDADVPGLLRRAADHGATFAFRILLRLPGCTREVFLERLRQRLPDRANRVEARIRDTRSGRLNESRFGKRFTGEGRYWEAIDALWHLAARQAGLEPRQVDPGEPQ